MLLPGIDTTTALLCCVPCPFTNFSVRVSNELGSGRPRAAWNAVMVVVGEALLIGIVCMALILIFRDSFSIIFTSDATLQRAVAKIAGLLGLTMVLNSVQPVVSGVAVGGGWQGLVAYINLGCYYIFGLPLGYLLGYKFNFGVGVINSLINRMLFACNQKLLCLHE